MTSWSYRPTLSPLPPPARCVICQQTGQGTYSAPLAGYVCYCCLGRKAYETSNTQQMGVSDGLPTFSIEFEVAAEQVSIVEWQRALLLLKYGYLRTEDPTVDDEYKSPIYRSLDAFQSVLPLMDSLARCVTERCGTHIHVDCPCKEWLWGCEMEVFGHLEDYISSHREEAQAFWGRFRSYNDWFNTNTRYETVEFRLPRFRSGEQYLAVVQFCRRAGSLITAYLSSLQPFDCSPTSPIGKDLLDLYRQAVAQLQAKVS